MPKPAIVTALLLVVAVLAFAGLNFQTVPMSTTQTIIQESALTEFSYPQYAVTSTTTYTVYSTYSAYGPVYLTLCLVTEPITAGCYFNNQGYSAWSYWTNHIIVEPLTTMYSTSTSAYSQTLTSSITQSSTSLVPASAALGLTNRSFAALAVIVIGILALLTEYAIFKPRITNRPKQATLSQFVKTLSCIKCGAELPPSSEFCNKCGTKQS